ncbi:hypothetical protein QVD17_01954 [Tagetes erecta]|uniref:Uncharacterized protein n=1 Tax=Tagetes erecta TaxID=13708 RepID=A0AAD8LBI6_TARER|nr:hypothetical protein QVD17_01954 [Tagetes erecta]
MLPSSLHFLNQKTRSKFRIRVHLQIHTLKRFIEERMKHDMEIKNLKLYMENMRIMKENEKLKNKAKLLHQENHALLLELKKKNVKL